VNHADVSGQSNPMFGKRGASAPAYGKQRTAECKAKLSQALKGRRRPDIAGERNPNWKGGKTPLLVNIRNSPKCIEWRNAVFARDGFTCQKCGDSHGGNLNAHHSDLLSDMVARYSITNLEEALACSMLWRLDNGITLCETCHDEHHRSQKST
jgi:5-methylcytosine-specific restriction endonuclease McrA